MLPRFLFLNMRISTDGLLFGAGILAAIVWTYFRLLRQSGIDKQRLDARRVIFPLALWSVLLGLLGARLLYIALYPDYFFPGPENLLSRPGLALYGAFPGLVLAVWLTARQTGVHVWRIADALSLPILLMFAFKRLGCLMAGCCYGIASNLPWAICYPDFHATHGHPVHPVPVYEILLLLFLIAGLLAMARRRMLPVGTMTLLAITGYALTRFITEFFRADKIPVSFFPSLSLFQLLGLLMAATAVWALNQKVRKKKSI